MAIDKFIPQIWSARLLENLRNNLVYAGLMNREYEGEIKAYGDTVKINSIGAVTIGDYVKNTDIAAAETLTDAQRELKIDQAKYFNFQIDDVDRAQQHPKIMDGAMREAGYGLANTADQYLASLYTDIDAANQLGSDAAVEALTADNAYEKLVDLKVKLDEANCPMAERFAVIPPWLHGLLLKDARFIGPGTAKTDQTLANGYVGKAAGFDLYMSNNVPNTAGDKYKVIGGVREAWAYAEQILDLEAYRPEKRFADAMKGLHVYGAKVVRPTCLALLTCAG